MSAICPLKVQKLAKKRNNQFFVNCRKTALLCDFWNISKLCKMRGGIFDSRTGHHKKNTHNVSVLFLFSQQKSTLQSLQCGFYY